MAAAIPKAGILNLEDYDMHCAHRYIASIFLTAALAAPVSIMAAPVPQEGHDQKEAQGRACDIGAYERIQ